MCCLTLRELVWALFSLFRGLCFVVVFHLFPHPLSFFLSPFFPRLFELWKEGFGGVILCISLCWKVSLFIMSDFYKPSVAEGSFSYGWWLNTVLIYECSQMLFIGVILSYVLFQTIIIWFYCSSLCYLVSGSWKLNKDQVWVPFSGMWFKSFIGWLVLQGLCHHFPSISPCRQHIIVDKRFVARCLSFFCVSLMRTFQCQLY